MAAASGSIFTKAWDPDLGGGIVPCALESDNHAHLAFVDFCRHIYTTESKRVLIAVLKAGKRTTLRDSLFDTGPRRLKEHALDVA